MAARLDSLAALCLALSGAQIQRDRCIGFSQVCDLRIHEREYGAPREMDRQLLKIDVEMLKKKKKQLSHICNLSNEPNPHT